MFHRRRYDSDSPFAYPERLEDLIRKSQPHHLIDVRTAEEYTAGHIPTARLIPYLDITTRPPTADKEQLIILYCHSGQRSGFAKKQLAAIGYQNVVNFGPMGRWTGELVRGRLEDPS